MQEIIRMQEVGLSYEGHAQALRNINVSITKGEYVAVLGHNGSGKSTFAKLINGLLLPSCGRVLIDGLDTQDPARRWEVRKRAGMVFQNPDNQIVATTVEEDVAFGLENLGVPTAQMPEIIRQALADVCMLESKEKEPHMLSGGQKQRVAIAGILAMQPEIIILDEATAMLDPKGRKDVLEVIDKLNHELGKTVIHITHYMEQALLADRAIVLNEGQIVLDEPPGVIFENPIIGELGLDVPEIVRFEQMLEPELTLPRQTSLEGVVDQICQLLL